MNTSDKQIIFRTRDAFTVGEKEVLTVVASHNLSKKSLRGLKPL